METVQEGVQLSLWVAVFAGMFIRWAQRTYHIVNAEDDRTLGMYLKKNWIRLVLRGTASPIIIYYTMFITGQVTTEIAAFWAGVGLDVFAESVVNETKTQADAVVKRIRKNGHTQ